MTTPSRKLRNIAEASLTVLTNGMEGGGGGGGGLNKKTVFDVLSCVERFCKVS